MQTFKVQKRYVRLILDAPFQARTLQLFYKLGWLPIKQITNERCLILFPKILDGRASDYLWETIIIEILQVSIGYKISKLSYCLRIPRTNSRKRLFFFNTLQMWKNIRDNDFVSPIDLKNLEETTLTTSCIHSHLADSFKTDSIFLVFY